MRCNRCLVDKDPKEFIHGRKKCLECYRKCREYYQANREREIARAKKNINKDRSVTNSKKRERCRKNPVSYMLGNIKSRAKTRGIPFNLAHEDIIIPEVCPVLGVPLEMSVGVPGPNSPSLDRINPAYGYIKGNVQVISHRANTLKGNATIAEIRKLLAFMEEQVVPEFPGEVRDFQRLPRWDQNKKTFSEDQAK